MADNLAGVVKTTFEVNLDIPNIQIEQVGIDPTVVSPGAI
jgi:hypothetical protein